MPDYPNKLNMELRDRHVSAYVDGSSSDDFLEIRTVGTYGVSAIKFQRSTNQNVDPPCSELVLGIDMGGGPNVRWSWGDRWREHKSRNRGHFGLSPIGVPGYFDVEGHHNSLILSFPVEGIRDAFDDGVRSLRINYNQLHEQYHKDRLVFQMANHLWAISCESCPVVSLEADATVLFILARLSGLAGESSELYQQPPMRLSFADESRIIDFIRANLNATIRNEDLAAQVTLSVREFHGRCVATFGLPPHQLVLHHRVSSAREYILKGRSLAEVAYTCGFADQSHMNRVFRKMLGRSPGSMRR